MLRNKNSYSNFIKKIDQGLIKVGIIGLGYVGLPLAYYFTKKFKVYGFDINNSVCNKINLGKSTLRHINNKHIEEAKQNGFKAFSNFNNIKKCDAIIICLPTPLSKNKEPDLSYIDDTIKELKKHIRENQIICLESTTYPGTTRERILPFIENAGFTIGRNYFLAYSPEREDPANINFNTSTIPKVVGGITPKCKNIAKKIYEKVIKKIVTVSSTDAAEMTKLLENIHRCVNISLVNEMKIICSKMNVDINEVIEAAATKPFGFVPYYPGPGLGGHCIPIDPFYLTWKAKQIGIDTRFIKLAGIVNTSMPKWVISKSEKILETYGKSLKGLKVLVLGIAFKKNVQDTRESPGIELMRLLKKRGAKISYSDPHVPIFPKMREYSFNLSSIHLTSQSIKSYDLLLIATDHTKFDYSLIQKNAKLIIDTRGVYLNKFRNVVKA